MHRFVHKGVGLNYIDVPPHEGSGPAVLLIHGFASNHSVNWVATQWVRSLTHAGYRVIALDNRGHGLSDKLYDPAEYTTFLMADDAAALLGHLGIEGAGVIGYSMGARIAAFLTRAHPRLVRVLAMGGLGYRLVDGIGLPQSIAEALEAPGLNAIEDPMGRMFRAFAEMTGSDLRALAACIRGSRQTMPLEHVRMIATPTIVAVGTNDPIAGDARRLTDVMQNAVPFDIEGRDHNVAVGDITHRKAVIAFFDNHLKKEP
ncbi:MAG TPA: alpha/beta fold hydrolase [Beijerinckiaceae bacterium]|nr:alpha/beta fold hydrolase [Beijerinckiaceae bacterium]